MRQFYLNFILFFCLLYTSYGAFCQSLQLSEGATISVLSCDSGNELYSLFGHTALRVLDQKNQIDAVYNYGYFDFRTPNFYLKFIKGDLQYFAAIDPYHDFLAAYVYEQRGVYEQKLNLSQAEKQKIFETLNNVLQSEKRFYTYKFIDRNCTTMVADVINNNINGKLSTAIKDANKSNRTILYGYLKNHFYENLGITILFGSNTDVLFDHAFLPMQLLESISISKNNEKPLSDAVQILNIKSAPIAPQSLWNNWYTYIGLLLVVVLLNKKSVYLTYFIFMASLGIFLLSVAVISSHSELSNNYNFLLFNPLLFVLVHFVIKKNAKMILINSYVIIIMLCAFIIIMIGKVPLLLFIPFIATNLFLILRLILANKSQQKLRI